MAAQADSSGVIFSAGIVGMRERLQQVGFDWRAIEKSLGLDPEDMHPPEAVVSLAAFAAYREEAARLLNDDAFSLKMSVAAPIGIASVFDYVALAAPSIDKAIDNWVRFQSIPSGAIKITRDDTQTQCFLQWDFPDAIGPTAQLCGTILGFSYGRILRMLGDREVSVQVEFPHKEPQHIEDFRKVLGDNVRFNCEHLRLGVPRACLSWVPVDSESNLLAIIERAALRNMQERSQRDDKLFKITSEISAGLKQGDVTLDNVARKLGMSRRGLQRILENAGTSFRGLLDDVRRNLALRYLKESDLQLSEIAYLLGYSELSAFSRAAKSWFGVAPLQVRLNAEDGLSPERNEQILTVHDMESSKTSSLDQ